MQIIGTIQAVQIQRANLKRENDTIYDPVPLQVVQQVILTHSGLIGILADDTNLIDVHNSRHHMARRGGGCSIGFTSHYDTLRTRFGDHLTDGIAGENIIIKSEFAFLENTLGERIAIQSEGKTHLLIVTKVVEPCLPFAEFCHRRTISGEEAKTTLQYLHQGRRGYKVELEPNAPEIVLRAGDVVLAEML